MTLITDAVGQDVDLLDDVQNGLHRVDIRGIDALYPFLTRNLVDVLNRHKLIVAKRDGLLLPSDIAVPDPDSIVLTDAERTFLRILRDRLATLPSRDPGGDPWPRTASPRVVALIRETANAVRLFNDLTGEDHAH